MRTTKREMNFYSIYDRTGLEKHLEDMAAKGWMLDRVGQYFWYYRRTEPRKLRFAVSYFPSASTFDPAPSEKQETYREFCEHAGWKLAGASAQLEVYWNEDENAVPLTTDPLVEIQTIHKTAKKTVILSNVLLLVLAVMNIVRVVQFYHRDTISALLNDSNFWITPAMLFAGVFCITELIRYFTWYFRAKKVAEAEGGFVSTKNTSRYTKCFLAVLIVFFLGGWISFISDEGFLVGTVIICYIFLIFAIVFGIKNALKASGASTGMNRTITLISCYVVSLIVTSVVTFFIFRNIEPQRNYPDEIPLCVEDIMNVESEEYTSYKNIEESSALRELSVRQENLRQEETPGLSYSVIDIKLPFLYDDCVEYFLREASRYDDTMEYREVQEEAWEAKKVYKLYAGPEYLNTYLVCYENRIVRISLYDFDTENNPAFAKIISEKLKPN